MPHLALREHNPISVNAHSKSPLMARSAMTLALFGLLLVSLRPVAALPLLHKPVALAICSGHI